LGSETGFEKSEAAALAAQRAGCTVLLKGADTVIAGPDGSVAVHQAEGARAAPWLATAGSGDVLAGFIAGLLARGFSPKGAAEMAAFLHVEAALEVGPGLIAEDLPEQLPAVFRRLVV
jgi:NAD(P)H-hydrate repair Nnr-like enzyme with NAD(P)H-hydrate dehydratase domain